MSGNHPPDVPKFVCKRCEDSMCEDCLSIAAEYEYLHDKRRLQLMNIIDENEKLREELGREKKRSARLEEVAKIGYNAMICGYIDYLIAHPEIKVTP